MGILLRLMRMLQTVPTNFPGLSKTIQWKYRLENFESRFREQILTGNIDLSNSANSFVNLIQGTLTFSPVLEKHEIEYVTGAGTLKLDNTSNAAQTIQIGLANTTSRKLFWKYYLKWIRHKYC